MINSIFVALSGMQGHERGLNVISNNVSNMNTPAFRGSSVSFADVFIGAAPSSLPSGSFGGQQGVGGGLDASRTQMDFRPGERQPTGLDLDLMLKGDGFFVLQDPDGEIRYTRAGNFDFLDDELVAKGQELKVMTRNASGQLVAVTLRDLKLSAPKATTEVTFDQILSPDDPEHIIDSLAVFDQQGTKHTLRIVFSKNTATPTPGVTKWDVKVSEGLQEIGSGVLEFHGTLLFSPVLPLTLRLNGTEPAPISFNFTGVSGISLGGPPQSPVQSTLSVRKQDGFAQGTIQSKTFDEKGTLKIVYSNGEKAEGPKLALAQISDLNGLVELGNSLFAYRGSQAVILREGGDDLQVQSQSLERSNVDLTQQFSELILMQRGYQASSQVISTANDMLQELLQMRGGR